MSLEEVNKIKVKDVSGSSSAIAESTISEVAVDTFIDIFIEDILLEIFDNLGILTVNDLLNFRLVNRSWRNAATSVLLKRNVCEIALGFCRVELPSPSYKYYNVKQPGIFISDLCQLISNSPKFPSTSICFNYNCELGSGNLDLTSDLKKDEDLFRFFSLYGKKMRKLSFWSGISKKAVQNLLYVHMPHLTCLDLGYFQQFSVVDQDQEDQDQNQGQEESSKMQICLPPSQSTLELKEIVVGCLSDFQNDKLNFLKELDKVSPNLTSIIHTHVSSLGLLLEMEKSHVIKDLHFDPTPAQLLTFKQLAAKYMTDAAGTTKGIHPSLKISKFTVGFTHLIKHRYSVEFSVEYEAVLKVLNIILSASKNYLQHLEFQINGLNIPINIFIPPLPHLEYLGLLDSPRSFTPRFHFLGDVIGEAILAGVLTADESPYNFKALALRNQLNQNRNIPVGYFPRLCRINLQIEERRYDSDKLMGFFSVDQLASTIPGDILFTVTSLVLRSSYHPQYEVVNMSKIFPNVSHFRSLSDGSLLFQNCVWTKFPKLERFEILVQNYSLDMKFIDSFFTGIRPENCAILESDHSASSGLKTYPAHVYERTVPYIGDCKNLKEIQIRFCKKLTARFVSKVTASYGFKDVIHRTKIIFSFEQVTMTADEIKETHRYLDPVAPYVEVRLQKK